MSREEAEELQHVSDSSIDYTKTNAILYKGTYYWS